MKTEKKIQIMKEHIHIDNGGYTFTISATDNGDGGFYTDGLTVSNSFFGYSENTIHMCMMSEHHLEKIGMAFIQAAAKIKELNKKNK